MAAANEGEQLYSPRGWAAEQRDLLGVLEEKRREAHEMMGRRARDILTDQRAADPQRVTIELVSDTM